MLSTSVAYNGTTKELWKQAIDELIPNAVVTTGSVEHLWERLLPLGLKPLHVCFRIQWVFQKLGVRTMETVQDLLSRIREVKATRLTPNQRFNLQQVRRLMRYVFRPGDNVSIVPVEADAEELMGKYQDGKLYITLRALESLPQALSTAIHEYAHHLSSCNDYTNGFQQALEQIPVDLLLARSTRRVS